MLLFGEELAFIPGLPRADRGTGFARDMRWILERTPESVLWDREGAGAGGGPRCTPVRWPGFGPCPAGGSAEATAGSV